MSKKYENDIDYKGHNIVVWNEDGKRVFAIGTKEFAHMMFAKEHVDNILKIEDAYQDDNGVWRWKSSNNVPPTEFLECWGLDDETFKKCVDADREDTDKFLKEYRKQMETYEPSPEELFEMKAAFGEGETVVNVITGKSIQL